MSAVNAALHDIDLADATRAEAYNAEDPDEHYESDPDEYELCDCVDHDDENLMRIIPYSAVYENYDQCVERGLFMPGHPVRATITKVERDATGTHHLFNPYLYTIELEHAEYKWTVQRRYKDFQHLNNRLLLFRATEKLKAPVRALNQSLFYAEGAHDTSNERDASQRRRTDTTTNESYEHTASFHKDDEGYVELATSNNGRVNNVDASETDEADKGKFSRGRQARLRLRQGATAAMVTAKLRTPHKCQSTILPSHEIVVLCFSKHRVSPSDANPNNNGDGVCQHDLDASGVQHRHRACRLPDFPHWPESMINESNSEQRRLDLERYLQGVLHIPAYRRHRETAEFLNVSRLSFVHNLGGKYTEGLLKKRPGGRKAIGGCCRWFVEYLARWSRRYFVLKDSHIVYMDKKGETVHCVLLFDKCFQVLNNDTKADIKNGLLVSNLQRDLQLLASSTAEREIWHRAIEARISAPQGSIWKSDHPFGSTFPTRPSSYVQWYVDGRHFMRHAANVLELAQEEIFIADWWLSPQIYLKRPMTEGNRWRLDQILKRKAEQGVKVFVLLYKEVEMALGISSLYSKRCLQELHPNVRVIRHPDHVPGGIFLWAHHEKLICVDQNIAFVGGIDLCYGRWDNCEHLLADTGSVQYPLNTAKRTPHSIGGGLREAMRVPIMIDSSVDAHEMDQVPVDEENPTEEGVDEPDRERVPSMRDVVAAAGGQSGGAVGQGERSSSTEAQLSERHFRVATKHTYRGQPTTVVTHNIGKSELNVSTTDASATGPSTSSRWGGVRRALGGKKDPQSISTRSISEDPAARYTAEGTDQSDGKETGATPRMSKFKQLARRAVRSKSHSEAHTLAQPPVDFADLVNKYKKAVDLGELREEKMRGDTPPPERRRDRLAKRALSAFKSTSLKNRWHIKEHDKHLFGEGYDVNWLNIINSQPDEEDFVGSGKLWIGKDYVNFIFKDFTDLDEPFHDFIDRGVTCRMPWHDIHSVVYGSAARDVARHFIQRWNSAKSEKLKYDDEYSYLMPKSYQNVQVPRIFRNMSHKCDVQVLRSASPWSHGAQDTEDSIQQAYLSMIANAKHYVYIENQFFVSLIDHPEVRNEIAKTIVDRIVRAHERKEKFRLYVNLPLMPGFEGQLGATGGSALQAVMYWTFESISRGPHSLFTALKNRGVEDPDEYICFTSVRTWDILNGRLVTELIYIHSKLIIVDDCQALIGSANINDRSQMGKRDSEVAIHVRDTEFIDIKMNGKDYKAGVFAHSLRKHLFLEHLGMLPRQQKPRHRDQNLGTPPLPDIDIHDITCDAFWHDVWWKSARENTITFENVFHCIPTDSVARLEDLPIYQQSANIADYDPPRAHEMLRKLRGHLVLFPLFFLHGSTLQPSITTKEGLAPTALFT